MARKYAIIKLLLLAIPMASLSLLSCNRQAESGKTLVLPDTAVDPSYRVADSLIYDVDLVNIHTDNEWSTFKLRHMNREKLVELTFEGVYNGQLQAYDFFTDQPLTADEVRQREQAPDYDRKHIDQIQFEENWFFSPEQQVFYKEISSFVLAYGVYAYNGELRGHKPVFKIKLKK